MTHYKITLDRPLRAIRRPKPDRGNSSSRDASFEWLSGVRQRDGSAPEEYRDYWATADAKSFRAAQ